MTKQECILILSAKYMQICVVIKISKAILKNIIGIVSGSIYILAVCIQQDQGTLLHHERYWVHGGSPIILNRWALIRPGKRERRHQR